MQSSDPYVAQHFDIINVKLSEEQVEKIMMVDAMIDNEKMLYLMNEQINKIGVIMSMVGSVNWDELMDSRKILIDNLETIQTVLRKHRPTKGLRFRIPPVNMNTYKYFTIERMRNILNGLGAEM